MMGKNNTMEDKSATLRLSLGKRWGTSWANNTECHACDGEQRSIKHALLKCKNKKVMESRKVWRDEVNRKILK